MEIAASFREGYRLNAGVAFRLARGWSQQRAADEWNKPWPDELRTLQNFSSRQYNKAVQKPDEVLRAYGWGTDQILKPSDDGCE